ncbi:hypothetical protein D3C71_1885750 [compost metagenome]
MVGVSRPSFLYDKELKVRLKYGAYDDIMKIYDDYIKAYKAYGETMNNSFDCEVIINDLAVLEVPPDQSLVDNLFNSTFYFGSYIDKLSKEG